MKNKKMFLSATAIATVALVGTTTTMAAMNAGNGKDSKEAQAKEAQAKKIKQLAEQKKKEQEKINKALNSITVQEINAEIKKQKDFKDTTPVANYTIPKKVQITKDGIVFDIALTEGKKDSKKGQISWKASISTKNLTQPKDMSGDLSGFQTDAMAKKIVNKKALGKMTEALINAEIEKYYKKKGITKSTSKAKTTSLPATVDVIIDNVTITVTLTKKIGDDSTGEISWDAEGQAGAQTQALNNKKISGFETDAQTNVKNANNAIKSITVQEINDAIDKHFVANNITKADEEASSVAFPGSVTIDVNGITVTVALTKGAVDNNSGNIAWTTSSITATNGTVTATQLSGTNTGFQTQTKRNQIAANTAINSITVAKINAAIDAHFVANNITKADEEASSVAFPGSVTIDVNGITVTVALTKGAVDNNAGNIAWTTSSITATNGTVTATQLSGTNVGFQTQTKRNQIAANTAINSITVAKINAAIDAHFVANNITKADEEASSVAFPGSVTIDVNGITVTVALTKGAVDNNAGNIAWTTSSITATNGTVTATQLSGTNVGFQTQAKRDENAANNAINSITVAKINAAIDAILKKRSFDKTSNKASSMTKISSVVIAVGKINVSIALKFTTDDDAAGTKEWTTTSMAATKATVKKTLKGINTGFQTSAARTKKAANAAINSITVAKINAAIDAHFVANNITKADEEANSITFPGTVTIQVNGVDVTVALTKGTVDNNAGNIAWTTSSITATSGTVTATQLSGTNTGFQTNAQRIIKAANAAVSGVTVDMINQAIDDEYIFNSIKKDQEKASVTSLPQTVVVSVNGIDVTVSLVVTSTDDAQGTLVWTTTRMSARRSTGTSQVLTGTNAGFQTQAKRDEIAANTAINSIDVAKINAAIDAHFIANNITKVDEEASSVAFPASVTIDVNGITVTVTLTKGAVDNNAGNIAWTTSSITATNGTVTATQLSGTNAGFQTQAKRDEIAANAAVNSITAQQVNDALKAYYKKQNITLADVRTDATPLPAMVTVVVNGLDITLTTTSVSDDNVTGTKNWNAVVSHSLATATKTITGGLVGFQTDAQKLIADTDQAINDVTATDVNNAIIAKLAKQNITIDSTVLPKEFTQMPTKVIVSKNGVDVIVKLLNVTAENDGTFSWDSEMSSANTQTIRTNLSDKLSGFQTLKQRHDEIMAAITVADIQKLVDAEFTRLSVDKTKTMPSEVTWPSATKGLVKTITIRNVTIDVKIIKDTTTDDDSGKFGWKATLSSAETTKTVDLSDTMSGLLTTSTRMAELMRKITNTMISDEILKVIGTVDDTVSLDSINPPKKIVVTSGKVKFDVVLKYTKKKATGSLAWEAKEIIAPNKDTMSNLRRWSINGFETQKLEDTRNKAAINAISEAQINKAIMVKMKKFDGDPYAKLPESVKIKTTRGEFVWNIFVTRDYQKNPNIIRSSKVDLTWRAVVTKKPMTTLKREKFMSNIDFPFVDFTKGQAEIVESLSVSKQSVKVENGKVGISIDLTDFFGGKGEEFSVWGRSVEGINDAITKILVKDQNDKKPILLQTTGVKKTFFVDASKNGTTVLVDHAVVGTNTAKTLFKFSVVISNYNKTTNTADITIKVDIVNRSVSSAISGKDFGGILINSIGIIAGSNEGSLVTKEGTLMKGASPASPVQSIYKITK